MNIDNDSLKELFQVYVSSKKPRDRKKCPSSEAMAACFISSTSRRRKKRIVDHISSCSFCRDEFLFLSKLQVWDLESNRTIEMTVPIRSFGDVCKSKSVGIQLLQKYAYILFGIVFIISSAIVLIFRQTEFSPVQRTSDTGLVLSYPTSIHSFSENLVFRWQPQGSSQYYVLELFDDALMPIWTSGQIENTSVQLPAEIYSKLQSGKPYFWMITAFSSSSGTKESKLIRFLVLQK
jgi:hypothetical protein